MNQKESDANLIGNLSLLHGHLKRNLKAIVEEGDLDPSTKSWVRDLIDSMDYVWKHGRNRTVDLRELYAGKTLALATTY
ncbi:MAG: hypothetical protein EBZ69_07525 [Alphaproteobacteria bacterium]|nr:hypothetical protein [Alphaproteobacteria bacterium]